MGFDFMFNPSWKRFHEKTSAGWTDHESRRLFSTLKD